MKNLSKAFVILLVSCMSLISFDANSQISDISCANWTQVGTTCVGACANVGVINYSVLCPSDVRGVRFCVRNEATSLCPNTAALVKIYVNGSYVAGGDITPLGSSITFAARCGSTVKVVAYTVYLGGPIQCVWQGQTTVGLRRL